MIVNHIQINYVPATTGNASNLGELVIDPNLDRWFIDHTGRAKCLTKINGDFESTLATRGAIGKDPNSNRRRARANTAGNLTTDKL